MGIESVGVGRFVQATLMFTRAGFNPRHRSVCHATVFAGRGKYGWAESILFTPGGDLAWYSRSRSFLVWAASPASIIEIPEIEGELHSWYWPRSRFPRV